MEVADVEEEDGGGGVLGGGEGVYFRFSEKMCGDESFQRNTRKTLPPQPLSFLSPMALLVTKKKFKSKKKKIFLLIK